MIVRAFGVIGYLIGYAYYYQGIKYLLVLGLARGFNFNNAVPEQDIIFFGEGDVIEYINNL